MECWIYFERSVSLILGVLPRGRKRKKGLHSSCFDFFFLLCLFKLIYNINFSCRISGGQTTKKLPICIYFYFWPTFALSSLISQFFFIMVIIFSKAKQIAMACVFLGSFSQFFHIDQNQKFFFLMFSSMSIVMEIFSRTRA